MGGRGGCRKEKEEGHQSVQHTPSKQFTNTAMKDGGARFLLLFFYTVSLMKSRSHREADDSSLPQDRFSSAHVDEFEHWGPNCEPPSHISSSCEGKIPTTEKAAEGGRA